MSRIKAGMFRGDAFGWELDPAGGEFSRENTESNFISGGKLRLALLMPKIHMDLTPAVGTEKSGRTSTSPRCCSIARLISAASTRSGGSQAPRSSNYYVFRHTITKDGLTAFVFNASFGRRESRLRPEPFTLSQYVADDTGKVSLQKIVSVRQNTRHHVKATATWNLSKLSRRATGISVRSTAATLFGIRQPSK